MSAIRFDLPTIEPETQPFWDGAAAEKLVIQRCDACGVWQYYPRPFCKVCWSDEVSLTVAFRDLTDGLKLPVFGPA